MQTIDIDKMVQITTNNKPFTDAKNHPLAPQHYGGLGSFRMLISGRSGRGKTTLVVSAIMQSFIRFDHLWLFVRDPSQPKYQLLIKWLNTMQNQLEMEYGRMSPIYTVETDVENIPNVDKLNSDIINLAVFDDMLMEKHQAKIIDYFVRGRHRSVSCIYITQSFHLTDPTIRKQCDYFAVFGVSSNKELQELSKSLSLSYDYREFKEILAVATMGPNDFLLVDMRTTIPILMVRKGFDHYWDEEIHNFVQIDPMVLAQLV